MLSLLSNQILKSALNTLVKEGENTFSKKILEYLTQIEKTKVLIQSPMEYNYYKGVYMVFIQFFFLDKLEAFKY